MEVMAECIKQKIRGIWYQERDFSGQELIHAVCFAHGPIDISIEKSKCWLWKGNKAFKLNHLLFMDDLKLFAKGKDQKGSMVQTVHIFSEDIGMQFGIKKCGVVIMMAG